MNRMAEKIETIGVLTSGGDAPGMNAAIRAVVRTALTLNLNVIGVRRGYNGLIYDDTFQMNVRSVSEIIHRGGTVLHTARCPEFTEEAGLRRAAETCKDNGIDALVVIGGDGSYRGANDFMKYGVPCMCLPGTIDNDIACTDYTIGYDTAMNTAMQAIDKLRDTAQAHDRCSVVEVMGRKAGYLAINTGIACGALVTLVPEFPYDIDKDIVNRMLYTQRTGKKHFIIIFAEGCGNSVDFSKEVERLTGIETRTTILGHVQRGGSPTLRDRVMASRMGYEAVSLLSQGVLNKAICFTGEGITAVDIAEAVNMKKQLDPKLLEISNAISV